MLEATKLLSTALGALEDQGFSTKEAMSYVFLLGSEMMPLFGLQKAAVSTEMADALHGAAHSTVFNCGLSYIPGVQQELIESQPWERIDGGVPMMSPLFVDLADGRLPIERLRRSLGYNFVPASDERPYFFQYGWSLPGVVPTVFVVAAAFLLMSVYVPARRVTATRDRTVWWLPAFFVAIGLGYIVVELAMIQRIVFYLGDPSRTLALLLAALFVGSGLGSLTSRRSSGGAAVAGGALTAAAILLLLLALPSLFSAVHDARPWLQQALAASVLLVLGVPMGIMFPVGLRMGERRWGRSTVPWMWAVNGSASVAGGALAVGIAMWFGNSWSLLAGGLLYIVAASAAQCIMRAEGGSTNSLSS